MDQDKKDLEDCKKILEEFLETFEHIPINSNNFIATIDSTVAWYFKKNGHTKYLVNDISYGPMVGGISERALCDFVREEKIFKGVKGDYKLEETYHVHSVRAFEAWPVKENSK